MKSGPFPADDPRHGTYAGSLKHRHDGSPICDPCRVARNEYMREHRKVNANQAVSRDARSRALSRLAQTHRDEYVALYAQELAKARAS